MQVTCSVIVTEKIEGDEGHKDKKTDTKDQEEKNSKAKRKP
jgi:hypothetical protein